MFIATVLNLLPNVPRRLDISDAQFGHAAILDALAQIDPAVAKVLHDIPRHKLFSSALLPQNGPTVKLRIVFHSQESADIHRMLCIPLSYNPTFRLGSLICEVQSIDIEQSAWSGIWGWNDLLSNIYSYYIALNFLTPTAFMKNDGWGRRYSSLFPEPIDVFLGLHQRWEALGGPKLTSSFDEIIRNAGCIISRHQLSTVSFKLPERTQIGFCGSVSYQVRYREPTFVQSICALARFAQLTGVGYQTARGMGLVQAEVRR